ncbi:NAD(P)/FAD-dependent oxidoreductase [Methylomonas sp. LW13]|uniref:NAD(P)/FAD-dependent oxidoreductase n=1 Tax=unclassified Methylomonas TaxID=2608980 RepID=UPI00051C382E|nr:MULTISPECIES: NAD(P)/FAD-dependent oxidoreductase [unclassified Methylomonas]PKD40869.1 NAD(P)/FAD-dependent oxidoreductase [Methylomonas sp. Kb3]QBC27482.1 NAD(P)/FAD-dependent oxidoreductase [Methylomonas sp. LW13]
MDADVLIIGAGPSGSVAAKMLKQLGHQVVILEKEQFPRFSIGESLLPQCMAFMEAADMLPAVTAEGFQFKNGAAFSRAGKLTEFDFTQKFSPGWGTTFQVPRAHFDKVLADSAEAAGVPIHYQQTIQSADFSNPEQASLTSVDANGVHKQWRAKMVLDASGFGRVLPRLLDLETPSSLSPRRALFTHIEDRITVSDYDRNKILIAIHPKFHEIWYWLIPFSNGRSSLGVVTPAGFLDQRSGEPLEVLKDIAFEEPRLAELLTNARFDTPANTIGGYSANVKQLYGQGFALLGNAGEFLDPVFSSGVTIAMKSAALAVPLVDRQLRGEPVNWSIEYERALRKGIEVFRAYVEAWYDGRFQQIIFEENQLASVKAMICSILAGYAWDEENPMTQRSAKKIEAILATYQTA